MSKKLFSILIAIVVLSGVFFAPAKVTFALDCIDAATGNRVNPVNGGCPPGSNDFSTLDDTSNDDGSGKITTIGGLLAAFQSVLNNVIPFLIGLGVFVVIYGIFGYISHSAEEEKRAEARQFIIWGIIFIFVMFSVWGLINILSNTIQLDKTAPSVSPIFPTGEFE